MFKQEASQSLCSLTPLSYSGCRHQLCSQIHGFVFSPNFPKTPQLHPGQCPSYAASCHSHGHFRTTDQAILLSRKAFPPLLHSEATQLLGQLLLPRLPSPGAYMSEGIANRHRTSVATVLGSLICCARVLPGHILIYMCSMFLLRGRGLFLYLSAFALVPTRS